MNGIQQIVDELLANAELSPTELAAELGVSVSALGRWRVGASAPRPAVEGRLRQLHDRRCGQVVSAAENGELARVRAGVDAVLTQIREALHRRGHLSSRNEALDECSKLFFAHLVAEAQGRAGISRASMPPGPTSAESLKRFVDSAVAQHFPPELIATMGKSDVFLRLRPHEDALADEIICAFDQLVDLERAGGLGASTGVDLFNELFGKFLSDSFVDEKELGQYLTPPEVVDFMVRLAIADLDPTEKKALYSTRPSEEFGLVLDPSAGVGSFLAEFVRVGHSEVAQVGGDQAAGEWLADMCGRAVFGIDKSERMVRLAMANFAVFGFASPNLHLTSALDRSPGHITDDLNNRVGVILTNPPFGAEFSGVDLDGYRIASDWASRVPKAVDSELLFLERYMDWLRPGGQLLAIVPDSILTNRGLYADLRRGLLPNIDLRSVVSLPAVTFASAGTTTKTSVLHLRKTEQTKRRTPVRFAVCTEIGYSVSTRDSHRRKHASAEGELPTILSALRRNVAEGPVRIVSDAERGHRWDATFHASLPQEIQLRLSSPGLDSVFLTDVAGISNDRVDPRRMGEHFRYIEISDLDPVSCTAAGKVVAAADAPSRARRQVKAGDILVSTVRPERRAVGVVPRSEDGSVCTTGFAVLRPHGIHPHLLARLLQSDFVTQQLLRHNVGIAYPAIEESAFTDILLPIARAQVEEMSAIARDFELAHEELQRQQLKLDAAMSQTFALWAGAH